MNVVFATCAEKPQITDDDAVLAAALRPLGIEVTAAPWTDIDPFASIDAPPIVLRSTWDYHRLPTMFSVWLQSLQDSGRPVWNPPAIALGNIDKVYLRQLQQLGIEIPRTRWLDHPDRSAVHAAMAEEGWPSAVLKPRIAATAYGTHLVTPGSELTEDDLAPARASGALLQEFIPEIADGGESSLVYCDGAFSHAVIKHAKAGDFRVQKDFGGSVKRTTPPQELRTFADGVIAAAAQNSYYARVDAVSTPRGPLLMELELIEPELYFLIEPEAAGHFAVSLAKKLTS